MTKQKLIKKYELKIGECIELAHISEQKLKNREMYTSKKAQQLIDDFPCLLRIIEAQRQCYIQFISDLKYELD